MNAMQQILRATATGVFLAGAILVIGSGTALAGDAPAASAAPPAPTAPAQVTPDASAWQEVITGQIEAFRKGDGKTALGFAGTAFQKTFTDPDTFMISIAASGYGPILTSVSHSFGKFTQPDANSVVQIVEFVGAKQDSYEAIYVLGKEAAGWRVQGVELMKTADMNI